MTGNAVNSALGPIFIAFSLLAFVSSLVGEWVGALVFAVLALVVIAVRWDKIYVAAEAKRKKNRAS